MMKKLLLVLMLMAVTGCANMSKEHQAAMGAALGGVVGAGVGALLGGKEGAAIGAAAGAALGGVAAYNFANDPYTKSAAEQGQSWKNQSGVSPDTIKTSEVIENGQKKQQIDVQKMNLTSGQVIENKKLSANIKQQLSNAYSESKKTGGIVHVLYPPNTSENVLQDLRSTGVSIEENDTLNESFVIILARNENDLKIIKETQIKSKLVSTFALAVESELETYPPHRGCPGFYVNGIS